MRYAVIKLNGNQYKVQEGQELLVDKLNDKNAKAEIMLMVDGENVTVGKPLLDGASVDFSVTEDEVKGKKLYIQKFKAKSRYRKRTGFRPVYSKITIGKFTEKKSK